MGSSLLVMERISKAFPGVQALQDVDFDLHAGEVHALVGENGAGKSTLMKVLAGVHRPDAGRICLAGQAVAVRSPRQMMELGVRVIYQELNLVPQLSVAENLFLGREPRRAGLPGVIDWSALHAQCSLILQRFQLPVDPRTPVAQLGVAYQQIIEIAKAVSCDARIVVMDEPTAALTQSETQQLFQIIRELQKRGVAIVYISHRLDEVDQIADRITVLRDGQHVVTVGRGELTTDQLIRHMVGRDVSEVYPKEELPRGPVLLDVQGVSARGVCRDVSFQLHAGEILGLAGLAGAGRTEIAEVLFGRRRRDQGDVLLDGRRVDIRCPRDAVQLGLGLIPEQRKSDGLVLEMTTFDNTTLAILPRYATGGFVWRRVLTTLVQKVTQQVRLKLGSVTQAVKNLSGGNQQKVVLAKWLLQNCRVYIFDEPTRGVDVGARSEIYRLIEDLARQGAGVLMISSDLPEILNMSDRILVVREGTIAGQLTRAEATQEAILRLAVSGGSVK